MTSAVHMSGIGKRFGSVTALDNVHLEVEPSTIHAIVGENGAGKTTLMRSLYGSLRPDSGSFRLFGTPVNFHRTADAIASGIGMVSQHYGIIPELTCLQNLMLGAEGASILNLKSATGRAEALASKMGFEFDWKSDARGLTPAGAQKLEILKLLWRGARVMILDEPTAMLSPADSDALFESLEGLVAEGATVLLVTHRLPEVMNYCQNVTVLRGGRWIASKAVFETDDRHLAELIVGESLPDRAFVAKPIGQAVLKVSNLTVRGDRGNDAIKNVSLSVHAGEIVGIAGVDGSGQRELVHAIVGTTPCQTGSIEFQNRDISSESTANRYSLGVRLIAEDRLTEGVIEDWSLEENAALGLQRIAPFANRGMVAIAERHAEAKLIADRFRTKHGGLNLPMSSLSGGNQQRFVAGRALQIDPKLIVAFQPARGLDLKGTADVYSGIRAAVGQNAGAIVVSFDLDELIQNCDRVVAMNNGALFDTPKELQRDRATIGRLMVGAT